MLAGLLSDAHRSGLDDLPALVAAAARSMGLLDAVIYLADSQQIRLTLAG